MADLREEELTPKEKDKAAAVAAVGLFQPPDLITKFIGATATLARKEVIPLAAAGEMAIFKPGVSTAAGGFSGKNWVSDGFIFG